MLTIGLTAWRLGGIGLAWLFCFGGTAVAICVTLVFLKFAHAESSPSTALRLGVIAWLVPVYVLTSEFAQAPFFFEGLRPSADAGHATAALAATALSLAVYLHIATAAR